MSSELPPSTEPVAPAEPSAPMPAPVPPPTMAPAGDMNDLAARVAALETRFSPNSWVFGTNFLKRAFGMWGHVFVAQLIIGIVLWGIFFACTILFGLSIAGLSNR